MTNITLAKYRHEDFIYKADEKGNVYSARKGVDRWWMTSICYPPFAGREDISQAEVLDACDIQYGPLSDGTPRRRLIGL